VQTPKIFYTNYKKSSVTARSYKYGDIIVTYIRRAEMPSHIYAKPQYMQESEYRSTVVIYIPT